MKAKKSYKKGGRMEPIIGMPVKKKLKKITPIGPKKIDSGVSMDKTLKKSVAEVEKPRRKKRRRKFDNGGKTKKTSNVNLRGEGKKKEPLKNMVYVGPGKAKKDMPFVRGRSEGFGSKVGPDYGDYINQEKAAGGALGKMDKIDPIKPKRINNDAAMKAMVTAPKVRKSTATIPVPAKKKKRRRKFDNGGKTNKDSVRTDTLERSVEQVYENARREEEERGGKKNNSGTTSGYRNVGRPLTTRQGAPKKIKPLGPKKIDSGVSMDKTLKRSSAKIAVPPAKKKRRLRRRK